jgi:serine/threonine-protein kinase
MTATYSPGTRIDHYEIIRMLGQGGMNSEYLAEDMLNQQKVVLKFLNADLNGNVGA